MATTRKNIRYGIFGKTATHISAQRKAVAHTIRALRSRGYKSAGPNAWFKQVGKRQIRIGIGGLSTSVERQGKRRMGEFKTGTLHIRTGRTARQRRQSAINLARGRSRRRVRRRR